ncbi:MAG: hypothetical protein R2741_09015 [Methanolobus sp.]
MKNVLVILLLSVAILSAGCTGDQDSKTDISDDAIITYYSYGAFTLAEMAEQKLVVNSTAANLSYYNYEGELTSRYVRSVDEDMRTELIELFENNEFMRMIPLYQPQEGQPIVADTGTIEISVIQDGETKTVKVSPYSHDYMPPGLVEIDDKLMELRIYAMTMPEDEAKSIAEEWIVNAPTYNFDGSELEFQDYQVHEYILQEQTLTYTFTSSHGGYGDRTDDMVTEVITNHTIVVTLNNGEVISALIDAKWDEVNQIMQDEIGEMQSEKWNVTRHPGSSGIPREMSVS